MASALFIGEQHLKDRTVVNGNVDPDVITPTIEEAQDEYMEQILGTDFYEELQGFVSSETLTGNNKTLMDRFIQPALRYWTLYELVPHMSYKFQNKNVAKKNSENSAPAELNEIKFLMGRYRNKAEFRTQRLIDFLCENEALFPKYQNPRSGEDVMKPTRTMYYEGMNLDILPDIPLTAEERFQD